MYVNRLVERQLGSGSTPPPSQNTQDNSMVIPSYVWITVVIFVALALMCGLCARRNYRRRYLYQQEELHSGTNRPFTTGWPVGFGNSTSEIRVPPRVRRRPSQASVTGLPVYMERPGDREVVLLQNTGPKAEEVPTSPPPPASPNVPRGANLPQPTTTTTPTDAAAPTTIPISSTTQPPPDLAQATTAPMPSSTTPSVPRSTSKPPSFSSIL